MSVENQSTSSAVDCDPDSTVSASFGSCVNGAQTSTISITNNDSATAYYLVEYSPDKWQFIYYSIIKFISSFFSTDTSVTASVPDGSTIIWRITDSFTSGNFTNMSTETETETSAVDCDPDSTVVNPPVITCSGGSGTATINITNNESSTVYYKVEYQIDSGSFTTASANLSIAGGASDTSVTASVANGSTITWRITDSFTSGNFTNMSTETQTTSATVDCSVDSTISTSFGSCSSGAKTSTISITNNESSTAYYLVEYQIDSGSFTTAATNLSIAASSTDTSLTASVPHGSTITWRIKDSLTSNNFSGVSYKLSQLHRQLTVQ